MGSILESFSFWRRIAEHSWDIVAVFDRDERIGYLSPSAHLWLRRQPADLNEWLACVHSEFREDVRKSWETAVRDGEQPVLEFRLQDRDGEPVWLEACWLPLQEPGIPSKVYALLAEDISKRKKKEDELVRLAYHDPLTGLANRRFFADHLLRTLAYAKRNGLKLALMSIDIDDFKNINDRMGHDVGDQFLQSFTARMERVLRESDLLARIGGDEFMVLLTDVDSEQGVTAVLNRLFKALRETWEIGSHRFESTVSIGIAMYPKDGEEYTSLLKHVDVALYQAKRGGGNGYAFFQEGLTME